MVFDFFAGVTDLQKSTIKSFLSMSLVFAAWIPACAGMTRAANRLVNWASIKCVSPNLSLTVWLKRLALLACLLSTQCYSFTIFNPNDATYEVTLADGQGNPLVSRDIDPHAPQRVAGVSGDTLQITYKPENSWAQTFFRPFSFLTQWGIGTTLVNDPQMVVVRPASFEPPAVDQTFNLMLGSTGPMLVGPWMSKKMAVKAHALLKARRGSVVAKG